MIIYPSVIKRFNSKVVKNDEGCWGWVVTVAKNGYAMFWLYDNNRPAARVMYQIEHGDIPDDLVVRHTCDNPICVNPEHLLIGTQADNIADKTERNRQAKGSDNGGAKLTQYDVNELRTLRAQGYTLNYLAEKYDINVTTVWSIANYRSWKDT